MQLRFRAGVAYKIVVVRRFSYTLLRREWEPQAYEVIFVVVVGPIPTSHRKGDEGTPGPVIREYAMGNTTIESM